MVNRKVLPGKGEERGGKKEKGGSSCGKKGGREYQKRA